MSSTVFVGLDLGTSGLKAVAVAADGTVVARAAHGYPTARPEPGASEQDPQHWREAVGAATRALLSRLGDGYAVRAVGLSAMLPTLVLADADGRPVTPAVTWEDARAEEHGIRLREATGADELYRLTGQWLDGRYLLPMYLRQRERDPDAGRGVSLLGAKDWLLRWLTGVAVTDPSTATGVGAYLLSGGGWHAPLLAAATQQAGATLPALPEVVPAQTLLPLRADAAAELGLPPSRPGVPVCVGGADSVLGALGMGVTRPRQVAYVAGTSTVVLGVTEHWRPDPQHRYLGTPLAGAPGIGYEMDLLSTGSALRWLTRLLSLPDEAALLGLAARTDPAEAPVFLPYLAPGEQGALWDPQLRGAIAGLSLRSEPRHLARGLLSALVLESRRCLAVLREHGIDGRIEIAGGSGSDPGFRADLADASDRPVQLHENGTSDYSALGAARLAAIGCGEELPQPERAGATCRPRPELGPMWAQLAKDNDRIRLALRGAESVEGDR